VNDVWFGIAVLGDVGGSAKSAVLDRKETHDALVVTMILELRVVGHTLSVGNVCNDSRIGCVAKPFLNERLGEWSLSAYENTSHSMFRLDVFGGVHTHQNERVSLGELLIFATKSESDDSFFSDVGFHRMNPVPRISSEVHARVRIHQPVILGESLQRLEDEVGLPYPEPRTSGLGECIGVSLDKLRVDVL